MLMLMMNHDNDVPEVNIFCHETALYLHAAGLERVLEETSGKFCVGDDVTIADVALVPQFTNAQRYQ